MTLCRTASYCSPGGFDPRGADKFMNSNVVGLLCYHVTSLTSWRRRTSSDNVLRRALTTTAERCVATKLSGAPIPSLAVARRSTSLGRGHTETLSGVEVRGTSTGWIVCSNAAVHRVLRSLSMSSVLGRDRDVSGTTGYTADQFAAFFCSDDRRSLEGQDCSVGADRTVDNYVVVRCF